MIRVKLFLHGQKVWEAYFNNYPTLEELCPHVPVEIDGKYQAQEFIQALDQSMWVTIYRPDLTVIQTLYKFGVVIGELAMEEVMVAECAGFDPFRTAEVSHGV